MKDIPQKYYFNTIQRTKNWRFFFVPGTLFLVIIVWGTISMVHSKAAVSEPKKTVHPVNKSATRIPLRAAPEEALSPEAVQNMLREKGLFDARRNPAGRSISHQ